MKEQNLLVNRNFENEEEKGMDDSNEAVARNENNVEMISEGEDSDLSENIYNNELKLTPEISKVVIFLNIYQQ